jgi:hypothetical protein
MRRLVVLVAALAAVALLVAAAPASAGWHYKFKHFIKTSKTATAGGLTEAKRCAPGVAGDWRLRSLIEVDLATSSDPEQSLEILIKAKLPITTKFRPVHDVDVSWTAKLPKDPGEAALLTEHYERLAKSQADFYETMAVRWRPAKQKLDIEHAGLYYDEIEQLPPGSFTTPFKPKPGC